MFSIFMTSQFGLLVGLVSVWKIIYKFLNVCPFDYTAFAVSGKVGPANRLTTPIE